MISKFTKSVQFKVLLMIPELSLFKFRLGAEPLETIGGGGRGPVAVAIPLFVFA